MTSSSKHVAEAGDPSSNKPPTTKLSAAAGEAAGNKPLTMRGRKRHKCTVCGNIARSRCPFFSCKGCCVKAGNSCHIHVLKPSPTGDSLQGSATVPSQGPVTSTIVRHPSDSLRLRTVRPLAVITKKEAGIINSWRFHNLRMHTEGITVSEDEAFDRYMQNMLLLEELFNVSSEGHTSEGPLLAQGCSANETSDGGIDVALVSAGLRVRQRSSSKKREVHKQRLKRAIDRSLQKLHKGEELDDTPDSEDFFLNAFATRSRELKRMKVQTAGGKERFSRMEVFSALMEKIKVVENQEDFDLCLKTYEENFVNHKRFIGSRHDGVSQVGAPGQHTVSGTGNRESPKAPMVKSGAHDLTFSASFKSRLDSYGVMRQSWKVDTHVADQCGHDFDVPLSSLERL